MIKIIPAPGSYISIGGVVKGGVANRVLYIDSTGAMAQSANMTFDGTSLTVVGNYNSQSSVDAASIKAELAGIIGFTNANSIGGSPVAAFSLISSGIIGVGTGAQGSVAGTLDATLYRAAGTAGVASFGPSAVTSITVKGGIITAIS